MSCMKVTLKGFGFVKSIEVDGGINPNGVNKIWTCGIRLRGRMENGESIWCENIWIEGCIFQNVWYNPYVNNGRPQDVSDAAILP